MDMGGDPRSLLLTDEGFHIGSPNVISVVDNERIPSFLLFIVMLMLSHRLRSAFLSGGS